MTQETIEAPTTLPALTVPTLGELLKHYPVTEIAKTFQEATERIGKLMAAIGEESQRLRAAFYSEDDEARTYSRYDFDLTFSYRGHERFNAPDGAKVTELFKREAWRVLVDKIGLKNVMSVKKRTEFEHQLEKGELPEITEDTILGVLMGLCGQAKDFAREAALEVFDILRPRGHWGGQYKTNDAFRVGRRVILGSMVESAYAGKFRTSYYHEKHLIAIDGIFHLLDGKGVMREHRGPLVAAINDSPDGRGKTAYFKFKSFQNRNLHLEFTRLDLVQELNLLATGEAVLGNDME